MEEKKNEFMTSDEVAKLLVELYADYQEYHDSGNDEYAKAVGIAIRMLSD